MFQMSAMIFDSPGAIRRTVSPKIFSHRNVPITESENTPAILLEDASFKLFVQFPVGFPESINDSG